MASEGAPPYRLILTREAERQLGRLDRDVVARVRAALERVLVEDPGVDVAPIVGTRPPRWRLRVGGWRVVLLRDSEARTLTVLAVARRGQVYRRGG